MAHIGSHLLTNSNTLQKTQNKKGRPRSGTAFLFIRPNFELKPPSFRRDRFQRQRGSSFHNVFIHICHQSADVLAAADALYGSLVREVKKVHGHLVVARQQDGGLVGDGEVFLDDRVVVHSPVQPSRGGRPGGRR